MGSLACSRCVTATGTSSRLVRRRAMASTRVSTGCRARSRGRSESIRGRSRRIATLAICTERESCVIASKRKGWMLLWLLSQDMVAQRAAQLAVDLAVELVVELSVQLVAWLVQPFRELSRRFPLRTEGSVFFLPDVESTCQNITREKRSTRPVGSLDWLS